jgi:hypothetical protein
MSIFFTIALMVFFHILDDYGLQASCLSNLKQKSFWEKNAPDKKYRYDYIWALIMHAFSWSFMIMLPIAIFRNFNIGLSFIYWLVFNTIIHAAVDDLKANKLKINLWQDQLSHMVQIVGTATAFILNLI